MRRKSSLRCAGGFVIRLGIRQMLSDHVGFGFGFPGDPAISAAGLIPGPGAVRYDQAWFRNIAPFCTGSLFNLTNGVRVTWTP